ncbi:Ig-like domain-containing protein [Bacillus nitratireducens]|uniref:Ig-like domain-containing protein n=1 Tax=Bacillus nitratireducens TaxID=2026193 RepID=UPI001F5A23DD|nr:Ig-like domain-containing protein [Bacillus nitratireducens]UNP77391.1 Ig-like domain-containing protein [Bacillus nitratireducens]
MTQAFIKKAVLISTLSMSTILSTTLPFNVLAAPIPAIQMQQEKLTDEIMKLSFEENLNDSSASNHIISYKNGNPLFTDGRINKALKFKAISQKTASYIDLGDTSQLKFGESTDFTVAFWVKSSGVNADPAIISNKDWNSGGNLGWFIGLKDKALLWNFKTSGSSRIDASIPNIADNVWHHITISHDRDGYATIYKDGKLEQQIDISKKKGTIDTNYTTKIGVDGKGTLFGNNFDATLDEVSILRKAVTAADVQKMYQSAPPIAVTDISIDQPILHLNIDGYTYLQSNIQPSDATNKKVTWTSSDKSIADIEATDERVKVIGKGIGKTTIQAISEDGKKAATAELTVGNSLDITRDGLLKQDDLNFIKQYIGSNINSQNWDEIKHADLNEDGKIDEKDIPPLQERLKQSTNYPYKHVFIIGLDGAGIAVKDATAPNIKNFIANGASTYNAQALSPTISAQNWGGIIHGVTPDKTKLDNTIAGSVAFPENSPYPSFMKVLKQERPYTKIASFAGWSPINKGIIEQSVGAHLASVPDDQLAPKISNYIKTEGKDTAITFIHFDDIDGAGHSKGYGSPAYMQQIEKTDKNVGIVLDAIRDAGLLEDSLIIMTTDHGGKGYGHGGESPEEKTIFWAANGPGILAKSSITTSMTNMDTAAVVAQALRSNKPMTWDAKTPEKLLETFPTNLTLNQSEHSLKERETFELVAKITPNVTSKKLIWKSDNPNVATIQATDEKAIIHAVQTGTTTITATTATGEYVATCKVTVEPNHVPVTGIKVDERSFELNQGDEKLVSASVLPENATNQKIVWKSSDTNIIALETPNDTTRVKALKPGRVVLTATTDDGKYNRYVYIQVK